MEMRNICKLGKSSLGVVLPKKFLNELGIDKKDMLKVEIDRDNEQIIIKKIIVNDG